MASNVQHVTAFTIHQIEDSSWLPDGEVAVSYRAYDEDGRPLPGTWGLWESSCRSRTQELYPEAMYVATVRPVANGERL